MREALVLCGKPSRPVLPFSRSSLTNRLTDTNRYGGTHRLRFDSNGQGLGMAGRRDIREGQHFLQSEIFCQLQSLSFVFKCLEGWPLVQRSSSVVAPAYQWRVHHDLSLSLQGAASLSNVIIAISLSLSTRSAGKEPPHPQGGGNQNNYQVWIIVQFNY